MIVGILQQSECFKNLGQLEGSIEEYIDFTRIEDKTQWFNYLGFEIQLINKSLIDRIPIIQSINKIIEIDRIVLLAMPEESTYNWHVDDHRNATLNLLINNHETSYCMFGRPIDYSKHETVLLKYKPLNFYLFNTQVEHMVVNHGPQRYMLSMQFSSPMKFDSIKNKIDNKIINQFRIKGSH